MIFFNCLICILLSCLYN